MDLSLLPPDISPAAAAAAHAVDVRAAQAELSAAQKAHQVREALRGARGTPLDQLLSSLGEVDPNPILSKAELARKAPPPPLSLGSKVGLGLLGTAAAGALAYGAHRGYQHYYPEGGESEPEEMPKAASVSVRDLRTFAEPTAPSGRLAAWAAFGF